MYLIIILELRPHPADFDLQQTAQLYNSKWENFRLDILISKKLKTRRISKNLRNQFLIGSLQNTKSNLEK